MTQQPVQSQYIPNSIPLGEEACEGRKSFTILIDFSLGLTYQMDLTAAQQQNNWVRSIQSLYVDNSTNANPLIVTMGVTQQVVKIPAWSQAYLPILQPNPPVIQMQTASAVVLKVHVLNFFVPPAIWSAYGTKFQFDASGYLQVSDPLLEALISNGALNVNMAPYGIGTDTDRSGTIAAGGTSQVLLVANASRKRWFVQNPSTATEILQIRLGAIGAKVIDIAAGATWDEDGSSIFTGGVWIVAATAAHAFTAYEFP